MTYRTDSPYDLEEEAYEADDDEEPRRGLLSWLLIIAMLMGTGSGSALIWRTFGGGPVMASTTTAAAPAEKAPGQGDLAALRREVTGSVQSTQQLLAAQQAEIKRLSEQVAALSNKLELLQRPVTSAQAAIPVPVVPAPAAAPAPKAVTHAPKKKPDAPKPVAAKPAETKPAEAKPVEAKPTNGPISTGGAPLQLSR
ncbi:hypothetical protein JQ628_05675 [Bradyrhizobium lablabi]|uniref:hypothetical protein n=1 Tax=Bradyrhizobium lablabi TaxID=722472 RepID=UPI001BA674A2|nr:hypothetical protein [Bradyrhizobium lablabi]MBR1120996.1 hypothetical protein [Bradyrhizobium lablabi]